MAKFDSTLEGSTQVKKTKIDLLNSQYDSFKMLNCEFIDEMLTPFIIITNGLFFSR